MSLATWADELADIVDQDADAADLELGRQGESPYIADAVGWARDKLGVALWGKQRAIARSVVDNVRTASQSCHGVGKSFDASVLAAWWIDVHPPGSAIVVTTATTNDQVHGILWAEISKRHREGALRGRVLQSDEWKLDDGTLVGIGRKPKDTDEHGFQGYHRRFVLVILDEACGVPPPLWIGAEAITTNEDCRILAIGNPDDPNTEFGAVCKPGSGWAVHKISAFDSPNFTDEDVDDELRKMLVSAEWVEDKKRRWGEDSPRYQSKVLGEFPELGDDTLISPRHIEAAQQRTLEQGPSQRLAVDVARFGSDRTVLTFAQGPVARKVGSYARQSTTETTGRVIAFARDIAGDYEIRVDGVGVGGGVVDQLAEQGYPVIDMQAGTLPLDTERFKNARAEWYWGLRERFEQGDVDIDPDDDDLAAQLGAIKYKYTSRGQILIESKEDMKKRGMPSPDDADTLMMAMAYVPEGVGTVVTAEDLDDDLDDVGFGSY